MIIGQNLALGTNHETGTRAFFRIESEKGAGIDRRRDKYRGIARRFVNIDIILLVGGKTGRCRRGSYLTQVGFAQLYPLDPAEQVLLASPDLVDPDLVDLVTTLPAQKPPECEKP